MTSLPFVVVTQSAEKAWVSHRGGTANRLCNAVLGKALYSHKTSRVLFSSLDCPDAVAEPSENIDCPPPKNSRRSLAE